MTCFTVTTEGNNQLNMRQLCEEVVNDLWIPSHLTPEQAAGFAVDYFKRMVQQELKLLEVECADGAKEVGAK
jgi:hypothetical protein